jgi:erythromycin esterase-like protein
MRWICERNAAAPSDPVRMFGFDMKQGDLDQAEMEAFLSTWAPDDATALLDKIGTCHAAVTDPVPSEADHASCLEGLEGLDVWFAAHEADLVAAAGERTVGLFRIAFLGFRSWQDYIFFYDSDLPRALRARDLGMSEVFVAMIALDTPADARVAIWAHNFHLSMNHDRVRETGFPGATFGTGVADAFGTDYAAVAITAYAPGVNWPEDWGGPGTFEHSDLGVARGSVEERLHRLREPYLIVDPRAAFLMPDSEQILGEELMIPSEQFAAILYLDESPPMDAVFW